MELNRVVLRTVIFCPALIFFLLLSCTADVPVPKPRTFPRLTLPERNPVSFDIPTCPFEFKFPDYAQVNKSTSFFKEKPPHDCWFDLHIPSLNASLYFSYHKIKSKKEYEKLVADTYKVNTQINKRSDFMEEVRIRNTQGVGGMKFIFEGAAASPIHFYLSDTTQHFVKGALYYNDRVRPDSMAPATDFLREDIDKLLGTFLWKG